MMRLFRTSSRNLRGSVRAAILVVVAALLLFVKLDFDAESSDARPAILSGVAYDRANRSVSIVLHLNDHRPFTLGSLDSGLYVDIENTRLSPELRKRGAQMSGDGLVQVKTQQLDRDTTRVILHLEAIAYLQAVPLKHPSRILVEMTLPDQPLETGDTLSASTALPTLSME